MKISDRVALLTSKVTLANKLKYDIKEDFEIYDEIKG